MSLKVRIKKTAFSLAIAIMAISPAAVHAAPYIEGLIDNAARPCLSLSDLLAEPNETQLMSNAVSIIDPCYQSLTALDNFQKANPNITPSEKNYLNFTGGYVIWVTSAAETIRNNTHVNAHICRQVQVANILWLKVSVPEGHPVAEEINNYPLRPLLISACQRAFPPPG